MKASAKTLTGIGIALFIAFVGLIVLCHLDRITGSGESLEPFVFSDEGVDSDDGFLLQARVTEIDQLNGSMSIHIDFFVPEELLDEDSRLTRDIIVEVDTINGMTEHRFMKGERMKSIAATLNLYGSPGDYPFDAYIAKLWLELHHPVAQDNKEDIDLIPFMLEFYAESSGYDIYMLLDDLGKAAIEEGEEKKKLPGLLTLQILVEHSWPVFAFTLFLMFLQWVLALTAFTVSLVIIVQKRKVSIPNFGWLGALVFAQISLRNAMPETPPIGTLGDSLSFFWVIGVIALSMLALVVTWVTRGD